MTNWEGVAENDSVFYFGWIMLPVVKKAYGGGTFWGEKIASVFWVMGASVALSRQVAMCV